MSGKNPSPRDVILGEFRREFSLSTDEEWILDAPGGSALYAAAGYLIWEKQDPPGILTRVGEDFPQDWVEDISSYGINTDGVVFLPKALDLRICYVHQENRSREVDDPVPHFSKLGLALPHGLIGYHAPSQKLDTRRATRETAIREKDIPASYSTATGAHLCPLDYLSHNLLPAVLRQQGFSTITLDPSPTYMDPTFHSDIPGLITGLTSFLPSEEDLLNLYKGRTLDLWEIAADLGRYGCEMIVIKRGAKGQLLYDAVSKKRWEISAYPSRVRNSVGAGDAFCGGFLAGYRHTFDPLQSVLYGSVSSSLVIEGSGPFFALDALPGLARARLEYLQEAISEV
jgi:sugar/nucleoside kinase (ribokinase family)